MLILGLAAAATTMMIDLSREKAAVENAARNFLTSVVPSATAAAYNIDMNAAENVVSGLFTQRAITGVRIVSDGEDMIFERREVSPTLPKLAFVGSRDTIVLSEPFFDPRDPDQEFGRIDILVDRSIVAPEIVDRLLTFFVVTTAKNVLFGFLLYMIVFAALARYATDLSKCVRSWRPKADEFVAPLVPKLLSNTEIADLGDNFEDLTTVVGLSIAEIEKTRDAAVDFNEVLRSAVKDRTSKLEEANKRLKRLAETDGLTGIYNRATLERRLDEAFKKSEASGQAISVLLIDIDHFKAFNDYYGHQAGDEALVLFAGLLQQLGLDTGHMVARYGGEEFAMVLEATTREATAVAATLHKSLKIADIFHASSTTSRRLTVSVGIASTESVAAKPTPDSLLSAADDALYEAKRLGRNQTVTTNPQISQRAKQERDMVQMLLEAIENRNFEPFLQPQIDALTGNLVGAEALVRWVREDGKVVPPGSFMPAAVQSGLITKIDELMLEKLCEFVKLHNKVLPQLSLNVVSENIENKDYVDRIIELSKSSETRIAVELLETVFVDMPSDAFMWQIDSLRDANVQIEIDDFGTGRTSILGLVALKPERLKIARELILPMEISLS